MKLLKAEKDNLLLQKKKAQKTYRYYRDYQKEVATARFIHSEMSLRLSFMVCCYQKHLPPSLIPCFVRYFRFTRRYGLFLFFFFSCSVRPEST